MNRHSLFSGYTLPCLLLLFTASLLKAQDTRHIEEPIIPPTCTILKATLTAETATSGKIEIQAISSGSDKAGLDTFRVQRALDSCPPGHAVELAADDLRTVFLIGPIELRPHVTLLVDRGVVLYASRNPESYAVAPGSCGIVSDSHSGCKPLISVKNATGAAIMGDGDIDGQGEKPLIEDGRLGAQSWWDLSDAAPKGGYAETPHLIDADVSDDFTLYRIGLRHSPDLHLLFHRGEGLTVWGVRIDTAQSIRNTPGVVLEQVRNVTISHTFIRTGGAGIVINAADGATTGVTITDDHIYGGRGLLIGDQTLSGVSEIRVTNSSIDGSDSGLSINSNAGQGGLIDDVLYEDICIRNAKAPISFNSIFAFPGRGAPAIPVYQNITLRNIGISGGGKIQFNGFDETHRIEVALDGIAVADHSDSLSKATHTDFTFGPGPVDLTFTGYDSTINGKAAKGKMPSCAAKFPPFPQ